MKTYIFDVDALVSSAAGSVIVSQGRIPAQAENFDQAVEIAAATVAEKMPKRGEREFVVLELRKIVVEVTSSIIVAG